MATTEQVPTNEQIAELVGYTKHELAQAPGQYTWRTPADDWTLGSPPDYLNDPATFGEAEALCRERGWIVTYTMTGAGARLVINALGGPFQVDADTLAEAWWTAIWRASETEQGATG